MSPGGLDRRRIPEVASEERLGREVFSGSDIRRRAGLGEVNYRAFYDKRVRRGRSPWIVSTWRRSTSWPGWGAEMRSVAVPGDAFMDGG